LPRFYSILWGRRKKKVEEEENCPLFLADTRVTKNRAFNCLLSRHSAKKQKKEKNTRARRGEANLSLSFSFCSRGERSALIKKMRVFITNVKNEDVFYIQREALCVCLLPLSLTLSPRRAYFSIIKVLFCWSVSLSLSFLSKVLLLCACVSLLF